MSNKNKFLNCYQDLQRAAISLYKNPKGTVHILFLEHALGILKDFDDARAKLFVVKINQIKGNISKAKGKDFQKFADEILTVGLLLKLAS